MFSLKAINHLQPLLSQTMVHVQSLLPPRPQSLYLPEVQILVSIGLKIG